MRFLSCKKKYLHEMEVSYLPNTNKRPSDIDSSEYDSPYMDPSDSPQSETPLTVTSVFIIWCSQTSIHKRGTMVGGIPEWLMCPKKYIHVHYMAIFVTPPPNKNPEPLPQGQWIWQFKTRSLWHITMYLVYLLRLWKYRRIYST